MFARAVPQDYWVLAPRAPHAARPSGYSWRVPPPHQGESASLAELLRSAEALMGMIDEYCQTLGHDFQVFDIVGVSQGAALASVVALTHPKRVTKVGLLSGFVPRGAESLTLARRLDGVRFFVAHGSEDELVSIGDARQSVQLLEAAGAIVTACEDEVGHKVSAGCLRGLQAFLLG